MHPDSIFLNFCVMGTIQWDTIYYSYYYHDYLKCTGLRYMAKNENNLIFKQKHGNFL